MLDLTPIYILAVIFSGVMGIIWISNRARVEQLKAKALSRGDNSQVMKEVDQVKQENKDLRRRIEILEAIVVDADMKLMTGLDSEVERRDRNLGKEEGRETDISI